jgi:murein DD-endopeptidase MepM/ murein hydrolase activator NlpD
VAGRVARELTAVLAVGMLVLASAGTSAFADSTTDQKNSLDQQIAGVQEELEGASQGLIDAAVALTRSRAQLVVVRSALAVAQAARDAAVRQDEQLADRLSFAQDQLDKAQQQLQADRTVQAGARSALGRLALDAYVGDRLSGLSVALEATSPDDFSEHLAVAGVALRAVSGAIDRLAVTQSELRTRSVELDAIRAQIALLEQQSVAVVAQRSVAQTQAQTAAAQVEILVAQQSATMAAIQTKVAAERQRLAGLDADQTKLEATLAARARAARPGEGVGWTPPPSSGFLSYPVSGPITSGFGMRFHPILHIYRMHTGIDFGVTCGTPVHAAADGEVVSAGPAGGYGNRVVIDHGEVGGGDLATTYNHLSRILVSGGSVRRGQVIALSGTTGLSTGCHLHFETLVNGQYVNPTGYL